MPVITSYSEVELAQFMADTVGPLAGVLSWVAPSGTPGASYQRLVNAALRLYPLTAGQSIVDATDAGKLETVARVALWDAARQLAPSMYNTNVGGNQLNRKDVRDNIVAEAEAAHFAALAYGIGGYEVGITERVYANDDYTYHAEDDL